jgi:hypothetical protein
MMQLSCPLIAASGLLARSASGHSARQAYKAFLRC